MARVKNMWFYQKNTQLFLHGVWVVGCLGLLACCVYYVTHTTATSHNRASLMIQDPHLYSMSTNGNPYHIYAQSMQYHASEFVDLIKPRAEYQLKHHKVHLGSEKGRWNHQGHILTLEQKVHLYDNQGQHIHTDCAQLAYEKKEIRSDQKTQGHGPKGHFQSAGFVWNDQTLHLTGPVYLTLNHKIPSD